MSDLSPLFSCTTTVCTAKPEDAGKQPFLMAQKPGTQWMSNLALKRWNLSSLLMDQKHILEAARIQTDIFKEV